MRPLFQLGPRLALCASLVREGSLFCDVGTDHAYLPIWLLKMGKISRALACDVNPGPLEAARRDGARYEVGEELSFRLSDGLRQVSPQEAEDIAIAGMGGELILRIIEETPWLRNEGKRLILQPMSSVPELREGLKELGFAVLKEEAAQEGTKVYSAFAVQYTGAPVETGRLYPYLVAIIRAFWSADIRWGQDSLLKNLARGANKAVRAQLASIYDRLLQLDPPPV